MSKEMLLELLIEEFERRREQYLNDYYRNQMLSSLMTVIEHNFNLPKPFDNYRDKYDIKAYRLYLQIADSRRFSYVPDVDDLDDIFE